MTTKKSIAYKTRKYYNAEELHMTRHKERVLHMIRYKRKYCSAEESTAEYIRLDKPV